jgi:hypothetical protein
MSALPKARGPLSTAVFQALRGLPQEDAFDVGLPAESGEDAAITLWVLYELSYRGFDDVDDAAEWHPSLLGLRHRLETDLERSLRERWQGVPEEHVGATGDAFAQGLFSFIADHDGPSLARYVHTEADREQVLDLLRVRSIYHLKEADATAWVVPRLGVVPKAALMELQYDEYGVGDPNRLHAHLFAKGMEASGLRPEYGAYVDEAPTEILEQNNAMSLFGLHRRLRGAAMGHLAAFEATSSLPSRRMAQGLERLGFPAEMVRYYAEHVEADAVHEQLAVRTICGSLIEEEPQVADDVWFGAFSCLDLENRTARRILDGWGAA